MKAPRIERLAEGVTLYCGDCREIVPTINRVSHVFSDPPYEKQMHDAKADRGKIKRPDGYSMPAALNFAAINDDLRSFIAKETARMNEGWSLFFCTPEGVSEWRDALEAHAAKYKRACVWVKPDSAPQFNGQGPAAGAEMFTAAWHGKGHSRWNGGGRRNVFTHLCQPRDRDGLHPTEKPVSLMLELVELFSEPADLILDPFMGSGTTGVACVRRARKFIGIELDEKYFARACRRIEAALRQPEFFAPPVRKEKQEALFAKEKA